MNRFLRCAPILVILGLALAGCNPSKQSTPKKESVEGLPVGSLAPEIEGEDIDGKKFKLSDYRGKVVVLDFWGNW